MLGPAATVAEALRLLQGETPDVALLDANLRGEPVTPVAEELRARRVPFVLASAYDGHELGAVALAGAPSIGKPTDERRLLAALRKPWRRPDGASASRDPVRARVLGLRTYFPTGWRWHADWHGSPEADPHPQLRCSDRPGQSQRDIMIN